MKVIRILIFSHIIKVSFFTSPIIVILAINCIAQRNNIDTDSLKIDSLAKSAEEIVFFGISRQGDEMFTKINIEKPDSLLDQIRYGKILIAKSDLMKARDLFETLLFNNPNNKELYYYSGIACRELANQKSYLTIVDKMYAKSKDYFERIIKIDPYYKDIIFQYSLAQDYSGNSFEALESMLKQINIKPYLFEPYIGLRNILLRFIKDKKNKNISDEDIIAKLSILNNPDYQSFLFGEYLRIKNRTDEAKTIFENILNSKSNIPKSLICNSLLKIYAKEDNKQDAENFFWEIVNRITTGLEADILFYDLKYLSMPEEIKEYESNSLIEKKNKFFKAFWERHNPLASMKDNPRIFEHYKRLVKAEEKYFYTRERFIYSKCKLDEFTDQGIIYIRYGEPDASVGSIYSKTNITNSGFSKTTFDPFLMLYEKDIRQVASSMFSSNIETWYYNGNEYYPDMEFHFWGKNRSFLTYISDQAALLEREPFDPIYTRILRERKFGGMSYYIDTKTKKNVEIVKLGLTRERSTIEKEIKIFEIPRSYYTFRNPDGKTIIDLVFIIDKKILFEKIPDSTKTIKTECNIGLYDKNWNAIAFRSDTILIEKPKRKTDAEFRFDKFSIKNDSCHIAVAVHPLGREIYGKFKTGIKIPDYSPPGLKMSDIEIGIENPSGDKVFNKNGKILLPKVIPIHNLKIPLAVYYEIYNLKKNLDGKVLYKIEYKIHYTGSEDILKNFLTLGNRESSITTEFFQTGKEEFSKEFINFDLTRLVPGKYIIEIKITDQNANRSVIKKADVELFE